MEALSQILLFFLQMSGDPETCVSTIFGTPGDKHAGGNALLLDRPVNGDDVGIAHRTLPLGSVVLVHNMRTNKSALGVVLDRGPYGAMHKGRWYVKKRRSDPGKWRGCADNTPAMADKIGHDGWDRVSIYVLYKEKNWRKLRNSLIN